MRDVWGGDYNRDTTSDLGRLVALGTHESAIANHST
jgi:hypothetical protein